MCSRNPDRGHIWMTEVKAPSRVVVADWCICCGEPRKNLELHADCDMSGEVEDEQRE